MRLTIDQSVALAEKLAKENGGKIPQFGWLRKNGRKGLAATIRRYPERFSHLEQESALKVTLDQNVALAEKLAKENGGKIPHYGWLKKNGYSGLTEYIRRHPERFSHLEQESFAPKTLEFPPLLPAQSEQSGIRPNIDFLSIISVDETVISQA